MRIRIYVLLLTLPLISWQYTVLGSTTLTGKITDKDGNKPIAFATVYFPDLKTGTSSDLNGNYTIDNLPEIKVLVQVSCLGYKAIVETIDLSDVGKRDFQMEYVATEMNEVVITGLSKAAEQKRTPTPITVIPSSYLLQNSGTNIIDAIASRPGISQVTTGPGISKPVIRGLGYNRVVVVSDGIRQEGQQWGDEHGIEVDEAAISKIEILKGPASLAYGSDALAGVVNLLPQTPVPAGTVKGQIFSNYQSNNGLFSLSGDFAGNLKSFNWNLRYSRKLAHAYRNNADGYVYNSGFREEAAHALFGINRSWGYSNLTLSAYHLRPGIIEGERDSATGKFTEPVIAGNGTVTDEIAGSGDFTSYDPGVPYQDINHYKAVWNNQVVTGSGILKFIIGFQQNRRKEYGDILTPEQYGLFFLLNTLTYDMRYNLDEINGFSVSFGINGMGQRSSNKGSEFLVPDYNLVDAGIFSILKKNLGNIDISAGIRFDNRSQHGKGLYLDGNGNKSVQDIPGGVTKFEPFHSNFAGGSGSIGATWQINRSFYSKLNISKGFRAPNIAELGANGEHEGTVRYERGDPDLKAESSIQADYAFGLESEHISGEANLFSSSIQHYIYARKLNAIEGGDSITDGLLTYQFVSGHALLSGAEIRLDIHPHPLDWIHFENSFSFVNAIQPGLPDSMRYLPLIPPPRIQSELKVKAKTILHFMKNPYFLIGTAFHFKQDHYYAAYDTETATPAYTLIRLGAGTEIAPNRRTVFSLYITIDNLADVAYQDHLSRLKYAGYNYVTGNAGVYNMGRNVSLKLIVPLGGER